MSRTMFKRARRKVLTKLGCDSLALDLTEGFESYLDSVIRAANTGPGHQNARVPVSNKLKHEVWRRDGFRCAYCGRGIDEVELEVDHIRPVVQGGSNAASNLQTLCVDCNRRKGGF
jgi:hypothetical protein